MKLRYFAKIRTCKPDTARINEIRPIILCTYLDFLLQMRQHIECVNVCMHADMKRLGYVRLIIEGTLKVLHRRLKKIKAE